MSSKQGAFIGSPQGARVAPAPSNSLVPITSFPQPLWPLALQSYGGPVLDLSVRGEWVAGAVSPSIFTAPVDPDGPGTSDWIETAQVCGAAGAGHRLSFTLTTPRTEAELVLDEIEIAASPAGPWYAVTSDHASGVANPWGLFLASASVRIFTFTSFGAYMSGIGASASYPSLCAARQPTEGGPIGGWRRTQWTGPASPCAYTADSHYIGWLNTWSVGMFLPSTGLAFRRANAEASTTGRQYKAVPIGTMSGEALELSRAAAFYDAEYDAIGMSEAARPPYLARYSFEGAARVYLGAAPLPT